ncbi:MAG: TPR repeat-containing protein [Candidatus Magnetoglobus multicellularis str. Araruama]|uniref:TPR repeat-containing protein n=1 Tax=Candidatus Magnetoglobus multicellularis str. Araruama TaxID=890399 RepID=A0A1V1PBM9_9BACT|nr:MAG: TPR repeat-containing protein [Candidatus Magnetoglobus multicellularis str. Araruama]
MQYNHIKIPLELSQQIIQKLKEQFALVVQAIESNQNVRFSEIAPLCDLLSQVIQKQPAFMDVLSNQLKTGEFFTIHLQHHDPEILNLPWCMAKDPVSGTRIEDNPQIYLINNLLNDQGLAFPDTPIDLAPLPLRILVMVSSPKDATYKNRLNYEGEEMAILHAFEPLLQSGAVEIHFTNNGSLDELKRKAEHNKYHLLHFSGHGTFQDGKGYLVLEDDFTLKTKYVSGTNIAKALIRDDGYHIPLVLLSACQSAAGSIEKGFHNVTLDLLEHGFPNIIAMSMSVKDAHATQFARSLYDGLNQERSIVSAFHEAIRYLKKYELQLMQQYYGANAGAISPFQYAIPKLYARTTDFRLFDSQAKREKARLESCAYIFKQSKFHQKIPEFVFIGRRQEKAELLSPLFNHKPVQIKGMGGVGKTAIAIHLAQRYLAQHPHAIPFFFNEESRTAGSILNALKKALLFNHDVSVTDKLVELEKGTDKILYLIRLLIKKDSRPLFIFDNLESFQQDIGGAFKPEHSDIAETITAICDDQQVPVLLTSRYPLPDIKPIACITDLNQIQLTDFWKKCLQLDMADMRYDSLKKLDLSESLPSGKKLNFYEIVQVLHTAFGGNFRALEFFNDIYKLEKDNIYTTINELRKLPENYQQETLVKMSKDLIFAQLMNKLDHTQEQVLYLLSHFNVPVQPMVLTQQLMHAAQNQTSTNKPNILPTQIYEALKMLHAYTLIEMSQSQENNRVYVYVTPIVKGLIRIDQPDSLLKECASELRFSHQVAGQYFYGLFQNQSVDALSELSEAFDHFYLAKDQGKLNEIGRRLANFYYKRSYFQTALTYCQKVEQTCGDEIDEWFYDQLGLIYKMFGEIDAALSYFEKGLLIEQEKGDRQGEGTSLNNIGSIYLKRGDDETALRYLEQSLEISREIGVPDGNTLNNIGDCLKNGDLID